MNMNTENGFLTSDFKLPQWCKWDLHSSGFWDVMQHWLVVRYRHSGTTYQSHLQGPSSPRRFFLDLDIL